MMCKVVCIEFLERFNCFMMWVVNVVGVLKFRKIILIVKCSVLLFIVGECDRGIEGR